MMMIASVHFPQTEAEKNKIIKKISSNYIAPNEFDCFALFSERLFHT
jgi:hypothetical protein